MIVAQQQCVAAPNPFKPPFAPQSRTTTPSAVDMWQIPRPQNPTVAASAQMTDFSARVAVTSVAPVVSLLLPLPYNETS